MNAIEDIITYDNESLTVRNIYEALTDTLAVWNPFGNRKSSIILPIEDEKPSPLLLEDAKPEGSMFYIEDEVEETTTTKESTIYFLYIVTAVDTKAGKVLKGSRVPGLNYSELELDKAIKIYNGITYTDETSIRCYLVRSNERCLDDEFLWESPYNVNLDRGLPPQKSNFIVLLYKKTKQD